jgi:GlcNAc-P-P-Und epimerase
MTKRILVTGASGFIGTNLIESLRHKRHDLLNIDKEAPRHPEHLRYYRRVDILDSAALRNAVNDFAPTHVVHFAARTDLDERAGLEGYRANTDGVQNIVDAIQARSSVQRAVFASTKLVCPTDATVRDDDDYRPDTLYGESKVLGEKIVKQAWESADAWCLVRPTSIWGPWCDIPYGRFFQMVGRGLYFHPGRIDPPRSFGYVGNVVHQVETILGATPEQIHRRVFYLSDYEEITIRQWADTISRALRDRPVRTIPEPLVRALAWSGDVLRSCGICDPPLTSFRLRNMRADTTGVPIGSTQELAARLPYSMKQGVQETIAWFSKHQGGLSPSGLRKAA